ncbi:MAG TPA: glycosyltransferase family 4 protein [Cyclobacteriaceae bacterium]|nr:glycosyltransferase family 4 protein [Cyclobacteriaceae bacterium]
MIGQTPPPFHGQAVATKLLLEGNYKKIKLFHIRLAFSAEISEVGKFSTGKIWHLFAIICRIFIYRFRHRIHTLYYMPVGNKSVPFFRDVVILANTRWLFKEVIFHFRVGGILRFYTEELNLLKPLFRLAYFKSDMAIKLSENGTTEAECFNSGKIRVVPDGMRDFAGDNPRGNSGKPNLPVILYVGAIMESKGIFTILDICRILKVKQQKFVFRVVGGFEDDKMREKIFQEIDDTGIKEYIQFPGVMVDEQKWNEYKKATIFCFPSFHETFGLVLLEAMQFSLPVVASDIGGIPSIVENGHSGFLVPHNRSDLFADRIELLLNNGSLVYRLGAEGRNIFLEKFTERNYWNKMEEALGE